MRLFKQPMIIGYIISGILVGPFFLNLAGDMATIQNFSNFGIALLLFIVGLNLSPRIIKEVGIVAFIAGIGQIVFTSIIGYLIGILLGFSSLVSLYVAVALTFSSTIIMMKLLSDKDAIETLYGKISRGFLLVQDFVAIFVLIVTSSLSGSGAVSATGVILGILFKGAIAVTILAPIALYILPRFENFFAKSQEFLFLFALAWGLGLSSLFYFLGFSLGVGALIAGVLLSISPYSLEISAKMRPLRDFFIISFFLFLGAQMVFGGMGPLIIPAIILSAFVLIGNPLIVMVLLGLMGYSKKIGFMSGLTVAQISEFSLILISMGVSVGHLGPEILSFVTFIGLFTIAGSTYMVMYSDKIYSKISKYLGIFERKTIKDLEFSRETADYILIGENRLGFPIMEYLINNKKNYLIVDYNPRRIKQLRAKKVNCLYGDASSTSFLEDIYFEKAKMIISTSSELDTNLTIIKKVRSINKSVVVVVVSNHVSESYLLYNAGADYVLVPKATAGEKLESLLERLDLNKMAYSKEMKKQMRKFEKRVKF